MICFQKKKHQSVIHGCYIFRALSVSIHAPKGTFCPFALFPRWGGGGGGGWGCYFLYMVSYGCACRMTPFFQRCQVYDWPPFFNKKYMTDPIFLDSYVKGPTFLTSWYMHIFFWVRYCLLILFWSILKKPCYCMQLIRSISALCSLIGNCYQDFICTKQKYTFTYFANNVNLGRFAQSRFLPHRF